MKSIRKVLSVTALTLAAALFAGCAAQSQAASEPAGESGGSFTDALGHTVTISRTVTAAACSSSLAELWQLAGGELAGVTSDVFEENRFEVPDTAVTIGSVKTPSVEDIIVLAPDIVLLSSDIADHSELYDTFTAAGLRTVFFGIETFDDYLKALDQCTDLTGHKELYAKNGTDIKGSIDSIIAKTTGKESPSVLYIRAYSTGAKAKASDTMTGQMLADLNCINIADSSSELKAELSMEEIIRRDPDFIFVTTMGSDTEKALDTLEKNLTSNPAWAELTAVKNGRFRILPKDLFHYKPNARWNESYEMLYEILYENG